MQQQTPQSIAPTRVNIQTQQQKQLNSTSQFQAQFTDNQQNSQQATSSQQHQNNNQNQNQNQNQNNNQNDQQLDENSAQKQAVFSAKTDNVKLISSILNCLAGKKETQYCTVTITSDGLSFIVEENKCFQALTRTGAQDFFTEYVFAPLEESTIAESFRISFGTLLDCLGIYGTSTASLHMVYEGYGKPLHLKLEEEKSNSATSVEIRTVEMEDLINFNFRGFPLTTTIFMDAGFLKQAFEELDWASQHFTVTVSPEAPYFRLATTGTNVSCQVDYPKESEMFQEFSVQGPQTIKYKLQLLNPVVHSLSQATRTKIRINQIGLLFIQHMIKCDDGKTVAFVDFFVLPEESDDVMDG